MTTKQLILLVEDDEAQGKQIVKLIDSLNRYDVVWAKNGVEALDILRRYEHFFGFADNEIKCILLDIHMPEMNGLQFLKVLRKKENKKLFQRYIPVVFLTAFEDDEKWNSAVAGMIADYIRKPFTKEKLDNTLMRILDDWDGETMVDQTREKGLERRRRKQ